MWGGGRVVARGEDPADQRTEAWGVPTLAQVFEGYMATNPVEAFEGSHLMRPRRDTAVASPIRAPPFGNEGACRMKDQTRFADRRVVGA